MSSGSLSHAMGMSPSRIAGASPWLCIFDFLLEKYVYYYPKGRKNRRELTIEQSNSARSEQAHEWLRHMYDSHRILEGIPQVVEYVDQGQEFPTMSLAQALLEGEVERKHTRMRSVSRTSRSCLAPGSFPASTH